MSLHVKHEVTAIDTFYHKEQPVEEKGDAKLGQGKECIDLLTCSLFGNMSVVQQGRDGWRLAQTHVSQSAPSQCPIGQGEKAIRPSQPISPLTLHPSPPHP